MALPIPPDHEPAWQLPPALRLELLALLSSDPTKPAAMTYDEFLEWADEDTPAERVDGKVIMTSPASAPHQLLMGFLHSLLSLYRAYYIRLHGSGPRIRSRTLRTEL